MVKWKDSIQNYKEDKHSFLVKLKEIIHNYKKEINIVLGSKSKEKAEVDRIDTGWSQMVKCINRIDPWMLLYNICPFIFLTPSIILYTNYDCFFKISRHLEEAHDWFKGKFDKLQCDLTASRCVIEKVNHCTLFN